MLFELAATAIKVLWGMLKGASLAKIAALEATSYSVGLGAQHALTSIGVRTVLAKNIGTSVGLLFNAAAEAGLSDYMMDFDSNREYDDIYRLETSWSASSASTDTVDFSAQVLSRPQVSSLPEWSAEAPELRLDNRIRGLTGTSLTDDKQEYLAEKEAYQSEKRRFRGI